jgi:hypothetical protein
MSPRTLSAPQTPADAAASRPSSSEDLCSAVRVAAGAAESIHAESIHAAAKLQETSTDPACTAPRLNQGKTIPGPDEWRALERRASSFRA